MSADLCTCPVRGVHMRGCGDLDDLLDGVGIDPFEFATELELETHKRQVLNAHAAAAFKARDLGASRVWPRFGRRG